ncbi:MurR/RpiR family transcriptional regulator [Pelagibacterium sediminicola]|uniref:MurR/RpiR family transcriptional regulator n=1 Tax=Pelagibacterium sediminicola TaxID=2248761 RepID=UPI000E3224CE|nr:MurR/RpiR family transcriptional regulator [Pelagibacterium sediminicola]
MPDNAPLRQKLLALYEDLPARLQAGAHWVIEHPNEVALLSMRDQAKRAGVPPTTMTRLAKRLGFEGYDDMRALYAEQLLRSTGGFAEKAGELRERRRVRGEDALSAELIDAAAARVAALGEREGLVQLAEAARLMVAARRIFIVGQRAGFSVAYQLAYVCSLAGCDARLLDHPGGIGLDPLRDAGKGDVVVTISVHPYARATADIAAYAIERDIEIIAITDSVVSPLARNADVAVIIGAESPSFFHTMSAAFVAAEAIAALVAAGGGERAGQALARSEAQFAALDTYLLPRSIRPPGERARRKPPETRDTEEPGGSTQPESQITKGRR